MKAFISFIFIGGILALGLLLSRGVPQATTLKTAASPSPSVSTPGSIAASSAPAQGGGGASGRLFYLLRTGNSAEIISQNVVTKEKKTIFADQKETKKIKEIASITKTGDSVVALLGSADDPSGQLVAIKTDGSGAKTVLVENFLSTQAPAISPDQTKLALVSFSNAEPNFGFTIVLMNLDGSNKKSLTSDSTGISQLAFSPDGKQIAFVKGAAASSSEIAVVTIASAKTTTLYSAKDKIIEDFDWSTVGPLAITAIPNDKKGSKQSDVYLVDPSNKDSIQITKNTNKLERTPSVAPDATGLAFVEFQNETALSGDLIMTNQDGSNPIKLGSATQLLGWAQ